jgi:ferredoxin--NADP+ reductase
MMTPSPEKFLRARITQRQDVSADLWAIGVDPGGEFHFTAGQYATLGVEIPHKLIERPYSIVSSQYEREVEFFIELVPRGELSPLLYELRPGDPLFVRRTAKGRFTLDTTSGRTRHLLLCTVTGIAPFLSYVRTLYRDWKEERFKGEHELFVIQGASRSWEFGYRTEMERIAKEVPWLTYVPTISRPWEDTHWTGETGRTDDLIRKYADQWSLRGTNTTAYLSGHPEMIEHGKAVLNRCGWEKGALKQEAYFIPQRERERLT